VLWRIWVRATGVQAGVELAAPGAGEPVTDDVTGGHLNGGGAVEGGERRSGAEAAESPGRARILPASRFPIPCSWVRVLAWTAGVISVVVAVMRRSSRRISVISSLVS
jgi:hypothetical protein